MQGFGFLAFGSLARINHYLIVIRDLRSAEIARSRPRPLLHFLAGLQLVLQRALRAGRARTCFSNLVLIIASFADNLAAAWKGSV